MAALLIIAHAPLASALKEAGRHAFAEAAAALQTVDVSAQMAADQIEALASAALERAQALPGRGEVLILTDVFGATPCNVAQRLADGVRIRLVTGVNVPMLWRALNYAHEPLETLVARAVAGATQGVMQIASARPQNQAQMPGPRNADDLDPHHHQQ
jgi:PTS system ascorbate-specific IIA component